MFARFTWMLPAVLLLAGCASVSTAVQYAIIRPFINDPKPLHLAAQSGDTAAVRQLLADGAKVDATAYGPAWTPLHMATREGHLGSVKLLVAHGADVNRADRAGDTPLKLAEAHPSVADFLRQHGAIPQTNP